MKCEIFNSVVFPCDSYIFLRDKFRIYNGSDEVKNIKVVFSHYPTVKTSEETVFLKPSAWYDFSEVLRDFTLQFFNKVLNVSFTPEVPQSIRDKHLRLNVYNIDLNNGVHVFTRYILDNYIIEVGYRDCWDCYPTIYSYDNRTVFRSEKIKDNYGEIILYGRISVPTQAPPIIERANNAAYGYVLHADDTSYIDPIGHRIEVNISGSLAQNDNCKIVTRKRMARINYLRGDGTGIVRWCEVANETIKTAQTKSSQRLVNENISLWVNDTHNDIKRTVTLEWRDFPPDEIDRIAMGIALTPACYIYMDNGTIYSGTLEQSATLKIAGNLQITLNVEIA